MDETHRADKTLPPPPPLKNATPSRRGRAARVIAMLMALTLLLLAGMAASVWWAVRSERGSAWLLGVLPGVQVEAPVGRLLGDFSADKLTIAFPGGSGSVALSGFAWRGLGVERAASPRWLRVSVDSISAARVDLALAPNPDAGPTPAPADLALPVELEVRALRIGELHAAALGERPIRDLSAKLHLGANQGAEHRVDQLALDWDLLHADGQARIATAAPMALAVAFAFKQQAGPALPAWRANASLAGPLAMPVLEATLRAEPVAGDSARATPAPRPQREAQDEARLDARATLRPFAAWPLAEMEASTQGLDLSALASAAPVTALSGRAVATSTAADQPASAVIDLSNAQPGRWDENRLPLRTLKLELAARPDRPSELAVRALDAELGTARGKAGRVTGEGQWSPQGWKLSALLAGVQPAQLDARAPAMQLGGPVTLSGGAGSTAVNVLAELAGSLADRGTARKVKLELDASLSPERIDVRGLSATAGGAQAALSGLATQAAEGAPWAVKAQASLVDFDPAIWWPGADGSAWRRAPHRLNAKGDIDLTVPAKGGMALDTLLGTLRGNADLTLGASVLAGVPLTGRATVRADGRGPAQANLQLDAAGNALRAEGRLAITGDGSADAWDLSLQGPALARLEPLLRLLAAPGEETALGGTLTANARVTGRWPVLSSQGTLDAAALRAGPLLVQRAQARWTFGTAASDPAEAQLTLTQASLASGAAPGPSLDTLQLQLQGTARAHTLAVRAESRAQPPAWATSLQGGAATPVPRTASAPAPSTSTSTSTSTTNTTTTAPPTAPRTIASLQAQGGIVDAAGAAFAGWRGTLGQLEVRSSSAGAEPFLRTRDVAIDTRWAGTPLRVSASPGRLELLGGALRWSRFAWQAAASPGGHAQADVEAVMEPLRIAPLLARLQPDFGWGGDLTLAGTVSVRSNPGFAADVVVERRSGDLTVTDEIGSRSLGLTDLRVGLVAANGTWSFTQGLAGRTVGVLAGAQVVRTAPQASWPPADAPLEGVIELRVDDLGTWGNWVPPGWRLGGALHTSASIGGRFGAPEYTGSVEGTKLSVRNFLEGVNIVDGDVAIRLQGSSARIERFSAKAGTGTLRLDGGAELGAAPKADLNLTAEKFQLLGRVDRRIVASGGGRLQIDAKRLAFDGRFGVDEGLIDFTRSDAPTLASDVAVVRAPGVPSPAAAASAAAAPKPAPSLPAVAAAPPRAVELDLRVTLGERLRLRGRGLDTGLRGELQVSSPGGRLAVNGSVRTADGTYAAYGQKLVIDRGLISFNGAVENPRLDIEATRANIDTRVGVIITGTPANPRVRLFSEPELSEIDKLSWLVMGRAGDGLGRNDTALLQRAALALLAGEGGGPTEQITKALGLDDISVRQSDGEVRETVIALGKQLSKRWYAGYERGLNATTGSFQLIYRIAQRFTLRAQSGEENSLDLIWTWRWR